jgi:uncharacterized protein Yka (UPF0111/DUF47 family)
MFGKLFRQDAGFFDLFNRHSESTLQAAQVLARLLEEYLRTNDYIQKLEGLEQACDQMTHDTVDLLHKTFITPLDRDEIVRLISRLDDIMDAIHFTGKRIDIYRIPATPQYLRDIGKVLLEAAEKVRNVVAIIKGFRHIDQMRRLTAEIHRLENDGDILVSSGISQLFTDHPQDPLLVMKLKEILESMEVAIDRCEDVANIIEGLYLEYS